MTKMTPEITQRIEQIRRGEVPEGYVKTALGLVPGDWNRYTFGDIYTERKEPGSEELPLLMVSIHSGVSDGEVDQAELPKKVKRIEDKSQYKKAVSGDLVFNMMRAWQGAIGTVRTTGMVSPAYIVAEPNDKVYPLFMDYYTRTSQMINQIDRQSYGVTDFRKRLYWDSFAPIGCTLPSIAEQQKIAAILTTQDKVIALKEKRLAEKQRQKKYLMQQLLTGKKRLPGFGGAWKAERLGKLFLERKETNCEGLQMLAITGIQGIIPRKELDLKDNSSEDKSKYLRICVGDIGYNTMRMWQGVSAYSDYEGIVSPAYTILKPSSSINAKYFAYLFKMPEIIFLFYRFSQGLVDDTRNLKYENFRKITVFYTADVNEQTAIAEVLSAADREIDLLRQDIEQEKQKKKALMQLLLTGIVRVNV
ncbi:restriction endonuclease subunit S [Lachnospiraceae bacterium ASD3451]|uniref:restriction endonuclease subunit S n=1 Tax=Diplocloster agilis TaxID=2850323 RepID=UPI001DC7DFCE|nr:restriction endonuclease subunit S [Diplocloster agilis]